MSGDSTELRNAAKIICPYNGWVYGLYGSGAATATDLSTLGYPLTGAYGGNAPDHHGQHAVDQQHRLHGAAREVRAADGLRGQLLDRQRGGQRGRLRR